MPFTWIYDSDHNSHICYLDNPNNQHCIILQSMDTYGNPNNYYFWYNHNGTVLKDYFENKTLPEAQELAVSITQNYFKQKISYYTQMYDMLFSQTNKTGDHANHD